MDLDARTFTIVSVSEWFDIAKDHSTGWEKTMVDGMIEVTTASINGDRKFMVVSNEIFEQMNIEGN